MSFAQWTDKETAHSCAVSRPGQECPGSCAKRHPVVRSLIGRSAVWGWRISLSSGLKNSVAVCCAGGIFGAHVPPRAEVCALADFLRMSPEEAAPGVAVGPSRGSEGPHAKARALQNTPRDPKTVWLEWLQICLNCSKAAGASCRVLISERTEGWKPQPLSDLPFRKKVWGVGFPHSRSFFFLAPHQNPARFSAKSSSRWNTGMSAEGGL